MLLAINDKYVNYKCEVFRCVHQNWQELGTGRMLRVGTWAVLMQLFSQCPLFLFFSFCYFKFNFTDDTNIRAYIKHCYTYIYYTYYTLIFWSRQICAPCMFARPKLLNHNRESSDHTHRWTNIETEHNGRHCILAVL